jgi:hypothetical protein
VRQISLNGDKTWTLRCPTFHTSDLRTKRDIPGPPTNRATTTHTQLSGDTPSVTLSSAASFCSSSTKRLPAPRRHARRAWAERGCAHLVVVRAHFGPSPHAPQPRHPVKARFDTSTRIGFGRMSGMFMGSEMRSRKALPKSEEQVSKEETLRARDKEATSYNTAT